MTEADKVKAAFERVAETLLGKVQAVAGTGAEVERIALDAVHKAFLDVVARLEEMLGQPASEPAPPKQAAPPAPPKQAPAAKASAADAKK